MDGMMVLAAWIGACLGSFFNVAIHRLPREESLVRPRSRCPKCRKTIAFYDNIPVLSWLWLRGRCRGCRTQISPRYPAVELCVALLAAGLWWRWPGRPLWALSAALAAGALVAIALIDWDTFLIPDELSLGLVVLGLLVAPVNPFFEQDGAWWWPLWSSLKGGLIGFSICWLTAELGERAFKKEAMGGGDIKLLAGVGALTGGVGAFDCLMIGSLLGSVYGVALIARGRIARQDPIPFGPFLAAGALFNLFLRLPLGWPFVPLS